MDVWRCSYSMEKIALVTGSTRGIGKAIAYKFAVAGYEVYLHYCANEEMALETYNNFLNQGLKVKLVCANLTDEREVISMFEYIRRESGHIDVLINNAASGIHKDIENVRTKDWDYTFQTNARGAFLCSRYALPLMKKSPYEYKSIVNITSTGSQRYIPGYSLVGGSKACVEHLTKYLACEAAKYGINVNAVSGGLVDTDSLNFFQNKKLVVEEFMNRVPSKRMVKPEDIANLACFLCESQAEMIRGQVIVIDGGASLI